MEKPDVIFCHRDQHDRVPPGRRHRPQEGHRQRREADRRRSAQIRLAELADLYLPIRVGSDVALLLAMAHVIAREGLIDRTSSRPHHRSRGVPRARQGVHPGVGREICEVPAADIEQAALWYGRRNAARSTTPSASPSTSAASTTSRASATSP